MEVSFVFNGEVSKIEMMATDTFRKHATTIADNFGLQKNSFQLFFEDVQLNFDDILRETAIGHDDQIVVADNEEQKSKMCANLHGIKVETPKEIKQFLMTESCNEKLRIAIAIYLDKIQDRDFNDVVWHLAVEGNVEILDFLLTKRRDVYLNCKKDGEYLLGKVISSGSNEIFKILIRNGIDLGIKIYSQDMLHLAVSSGKVDFVETLLCNGFDINSACNSMQMTPLMLACHRDDVDMAAELIRLGADINAENTRGETAMIIAAGQYGECTGLLLCHPVKYLNKSLSDYNFEKAKKQYRDFIEKIEVGDKQKLPTKDMQILPPVFKNCIEDSNVNHQDLHGCTALICAIDNERIHSVRLLLANSASLKIKDFNGKDAMAYAKQRGNIEILRILKEFEQRSVQKKRSSREMAKSFKKAKRILLL